MNSFEISTLYMHSVGELEKFKYPTSRLRLVIPPGCASAVDPALGAILRLSKKVEDGTLTSFCIEDEFYSSVYLYFSRTLYLWKPHPGFQSLGLSLPQAKPLLRDLVSLLSQSEFPLPSFLEPPVKILELVENFVKILSQMNVPK